MDRIALELVVSVVSIIMWQIGFNAVSLSAQLVKFMSLFEFLCLYVLPSLEHLPLKHTRTT